MSLLNWLISLNPEVRDAIMFLMGMGVVYAVNRLYTLHVKAKEDLAYKYNTLNVLVFHLCKEHQRTTGVPLIKEGANSKGDFGVDHTT